MDVDHEVAKLLVQLSQSQDDEIGMWISSYLYLDILDSYKHHNHFLLHRHASECRSIIINISTKTTVFMWSNFLLFLYNNSFVYYHIVLIVWCFIEDFKYIISIIFWSNTYFLNSLLSVFLNSYSEVPVLSFKHTKYYNFGMLNILSYFCILLSP